MWRPSHWASAPKRSRSEHPAPSCLSARQPTPSTQPESPTMAKVVESKKACTVNPLKMSQPLGASLAFLGLADCMPVMHGSQGCTSFGLVLLVRHFKEAIPLQTTAKGDDVEGFLVTARQRHPELADTEIVYVSTPDYVGAFEDGYRLALTGLVQQLVKPLPVQPRQVTLLPGSHLSPGDIDELREIIEAFGLQAVVLPDLSGSLDGHIAPDWRGTTLGGTSLEDIRATGASAFTLGVGEQTRQAAQALQAIAGTPFEVFERLTGLEPNDRLLLRLSQVSGQPVPARLRRQRSQLLDAMLDGHFYTGGIKVALGAEPDLLLAVGALLHEMGAELSVCISTTASPAHALLPAAEVLLGDLEDLERLAVDCDVLITHSHRRQVGYRGTMNLIFEIANLMIEHLPHHHAGDWPLSPEAQRAATSLGHPANRPVASAAPVTQAMHQAPPPALASNV